MSTGQLPKSMMHDILECVYSPDPVLDTSAIEAREPLSMTLSAFGSRPGATEPTKLRPEFADNHTQRVMIDIAREIEEREMIAAIVAKPRPKPAYQPRESLGTKGDYFVPLMWTPEEKRRRRELERGLNPIGDAEMTAAMRKAGLWSKGKGMGEIMLGATRAKEAMKHARTFIGKNTGTRS